jgi:hypothetical protein
MQTSIWLSSHLVRARNSRSEVHEFEYPMRKDPWHQVFLQDAMTSIQYILYLSRSLNKSYGVTFAFDLSFHMLFFHRYMENCIEIAIVVRVQIVFEIITMCYPAHLKLLPARTGLTIANSEYNIVIMRWLSCYLYA